MYVHGSGKGLIEAARGDKIDGLEAAGVLIKVPYGQYLKQTEGIRSDQCWASFQNGDLKKETERLKMAAQNQSIRANLVKVKIDKSLGDSLCRVCRKVDKSIDHIVSGCSKLALN